MAALQSVRPYVVRDRKVYCAACGRRRLCRITGTRYVACPDCDSGKAVETSRGQVTIAAGEILCANCGRSELVADPKAGGLACPVCDIPPWERTQVAQPTATQLLIPGTTREALSVALEAPEHAPARPDDVVRTCFYCGQTCWHTHRWELSRWRARCTGCDSRLSTTRAKGARGNKRGDRS